jgi:hypothetical protein
MNWSVPPSAQQDITILRIPLQAEYTILVFSEVALLNLSWVSLVYVSESDVSLSSCKGIVSALWVYCASL